MVLGHEQHSPGLVRCEPRGPQSSSGIDRWLAMVGADGVQQRQFANMLVRAAPDCCSHSIATFLCERIF